MVFGSLQIVDSTHTIANVNVQKDDHRQKKGESPRDPSAQWGVKHARTVRDENGKKRKVPEYFYGYKMHTSFNAEAQMITSVVVSPGQRYDGHYLPSLIESDLAQGLPIEVCTADRGYDDTDNHFFLQTRGISSAIHLNRYRTQKKDSNRRCGEAAPQDTQHHRQTAHDWQGRGQGHRPGCLSRTQSRDC